MDDCTSPEAQPSQLRAPLHAGKDRPYMDLQVTVEGIDVLLPRARGTSAWSWTINCVALPTSLQWPILQIHSPQHPQDPAFLTREERLLVQGLVFSHLDYLHLDPGCIHDECLSNMTPSPSFVTSTGSCSSSHQIQDNGAGLQACQWTPPTSKH